MQPLTGRHARHISSLRHSPVSTRRIRKVPAQAVKTDPILIKINAVLIDEGEAYFHPQWQKLLKAGVQCPTLDSSLRTSSITCLRQHRRQR